MTTNDPSKSSPTYHRCHCLQAQAGENYKRMEETESIYITTDNVSSSQLSQSNNKKPIRKAVKVKPEEVSTPTHFEHLVHIEDLQSNANNFVATELSHDPIIRNIFNMIEKNITNTDSNTITVTTPTSNDNITELYLESTVTNRESNPENVAVHSHNIETYDNFAVPFCTVDKEQLVEQGNNLKYSRKVLDNTKHQSIPYTLSSDFRERNSQNSTKSFPMLPKHAKLTPISSSNSTETISSIIPFTTTSVQFQYPDLQKQEAAYDALVSQNTRELTSSLYENDDVEAKLIDFNDQMEIQQALKQLDDALDERIPIETFRTSLNPKQSHMDRFEGKFAKSKDCKKSVKQLVEMLDSEQLQFGMLNMPSKSHQTVANPDSDFIAADSEIRTNPETPSKPSLIGVNIFALNDDKSIAEIIAEKQNYQNFPLHKPPPTSPKPVLKKPFPIPKLNTSDEEEQKLFLPSSSSSQTIHTSEKLISDDRIDFMITATNKKPKIQAKHQIISNSAMLSTIIKVDDSESSGNSQSTMTDPTSVIPAVIDAAGKNSNRQRLPEIKYQAVNSTSKNFNQNESEKFLETSFDGPIAMTIISGSKDGRTKDFTYVCDKDVSHMLHHHQEQQQQQQQRKDSVADNENGKLIVDNTSATIISVSQYDTCNHDHGVKWRSDSMKGANFDVSLENDRNSEPIPPQRTCFRLNSFGSISDKRMIQRSTSMCQSSSNNELNDITIKSTSSIIQQRPTFINRLSSMSFPETARISIPPKPAPRKIDCTKRNTINADVTEIQRRNFGREPKRPIPIPRRSKLKATLNDDLLKKVSFAPTKVQYGIVSSPESMITIAKTMGKVNEDENDRSEWMLRL